MLIFFSLLNWDQLMRREFTLLGVFFSFKVAMYFPFLLFFVWSESNMKTNCV